MGKFKLSEVSISGMYDDIAFLVSQFALMDFAQDVNKIARIATAYNLECPFCGLKHNARAKTCVEKRHGS